MSGMKKEFRKKRKKATYGAKWWKLIELKDWLLLVAILVVFVWLIIDEDSITFIILLPLLFYAVLKDLLKLK